MNPWMKLLRVNSLRVEIGNPDCRLLQFLRDKIFSKVLWIVLGKGLVLAAAEGELKFQSSSPQEIAVSRNADSLILSTPFYVIEHDLRRGGAIKQISLTHGRAANLLVQPMATKVRDEAGRWFSNLNDAAAEVSHKAEGRKQVVSVESELKDDKGRGSGVRMKTTYEYRWGYLKIRKEFQTTDKGMKVQEVCVVSSVLAPSLTDYGYREGTTEAEGAPPFSFGSNRWGKLRPGEATDEGVKTQYIPRSMILVDPGVEGLEWFAGSKLAQWDVQLARERGKGKCFLNRSKNPDGLALSISPFASTNSTVALPEHCTFDFYIGIPLLEGHAFRPWLHGSFNRNKGEWVSAEQVNQWVEQGIQTVHCHNDGDYYDDGLFWRDGSYPPYPDMERYDKVLQECRKVGIRAATYFSNKELHPSTKEFQEHGEEWGRKNRKGELQHNFYKPKSEFGAQMCLRSGWLDFLKFSIDRVLKNHPLDGVYFDWNVALLCMNPLHEGKTDSAPAQGHWDIDELLDLMEWTRERVGPNGLVIVHDTTTPMFATENFSDYVVATEWGYKKWTEQAAGLAELPVEWSLAGARPRGVISYGTIDSKAARRLHKVFALEALLGGVAPWPPSPETFELMPLLQPLGEVESYKFSDWRNDAVRLSDTNCASAVYSRPGEASVLVGNLDKQTREVTCVLDPRKLPHPLSETQAAIQYAVAKDSAKGEELTLTPLEAAKVVGEGAKITIPGDSVVLVQVKAFQPTVEIEEEVYLYEPANNGAGPMWCSGSTSLVRTGDRLYASGLETLKDVPPLNNCRWVLFEREARGWKKIYTDEGRTREPSPLVGFRDGTLFVSANPTLGKNPEPNGGPAQPQVVQWAYGGQIARLLPRWEGTPQFTEHSYRSFAADGPNKEMILFQNIGYTHAEWAFYDREGNWPAQGKLKWPWGADYEKPQPIRVCYPNVALRKRAVFFCGVSDILEPNSKWREYKKQITGREWDYDFRRLFFTWTPDITKTPFAEWVEVSSREKTGGWISPGDLWVDSKETVHIVWTERAIDERLREKFFPEARQRHSLEYAQIRNGAVTLRKTLVETTEGKGEIPSAARFQVTPEERLFVICYVQGTSSEGKPVSENRIAEILPDGARTDFARVPLEKPFTSFFTTTVRAGSTPSHVIELLGTQAGSQQTISYARVRLY